MCPYLTRHIIDLWFWDISGTSDNGDVVEADRILASTVVTIIGGDAVVGHALELLLRSAECDARFISESSLAEEVGALERAELLLIAPGLSSARNEELLSMLRATEATKNLPVMELTSNIAATRLGIRHFVAPWPCPTEELQRQIREVLLSGRERA